MTNPHRYTTSYPPSASELLELVKYRVLTVNEARRFLLGPDARALLDEAATETYDMNALLRGRHTA
jgi:hypothetical protein